MKQFLRFQTPFSSVVKDEWAENRCKIMEL